MLSKRLKGMMTNESAKEKCTLDEPTKADPTANMKLDQPDHLVTREVAATNGDPCRCINIHQERDGARIAKTPQRFLTQPRWSKNGQTHLRLVEVQNLEELADSM